MTAGNDAYRVSVLGLGNVLFGDDGFGPLVIQLLRAGWEFPASVNVVDVGTPGLDLVTYFHGASTVVLIDAVGSRGVPGELRLYRGAELQRLQPKPRVSPHDPAVLESLLIADLAGDGPREVLLVGAIPQSVELGTGLTPAVRRAATEAADLVVQTLSNAGASPVARLQPRAPDVWWMLPAA